MTSALLNNAVTVSTTNYHGNLPTGIADAWTHSLRLHGGFDKLYQSPVWFEHKYRCNNAKDLVLTCIRGSDGEFCAVVPVRRSNLDLSIQTRGIRLLPNTLKVWSVSGNTLAIPNQYQITESVLQELLNDRPAVHLRMIAVRSELYKQIARYARENLCVRMININKQFDRHLIALPKTFSDYLAKFDAKKRYNLKRQLSLLGKTEKGAVQLRSFVQPDEVHAFISEIEPIVRTSWQSRISNDVIESTDERLKDFESLAELGLFRSYILYVGKQAAAFCFGLEFDGTYYFDTTAYLPTFANSSPGSVLIYLLVQELIDDTNGRLKLLNFGYGDHSYKRTFANIHERVVELLVLKPNFYTASKVNLFLAFRWLASQIKR